MAPNHPLRRQILANLQPKMETEIAIVDSYRRHLRETVRETRRASMRRQLAWLAVILAALLLAIAVGCLLDLVCSPLFSGIAANILIAGIWGGYHLLTRR